MHIDIICLIIIVVSIIFGIKKGFIFEFFSIFGIVLAVMFSKKYAISIYEFFYRNSSDNKGGHTVSYVIAFLGMYFLIFIMLFLLKKFFEAIMLGWIDKLLGGVAGLAKGLLLCFVFLVVLSVIATQSKSMDKNMKQAVSSKMLTYISPDIYNVFPDKIKQMTQRYLNKNYVNGKSLDDLIEKVMKENKELTQDQTEKLNNIMKKKDKDEVDEEFLNNLLNDMKDKDDAKGKKGDTK